MLPTWSGVGTCWVWRATSRLRSIFRGKFKDFLEQAYRQRKLELQGPLEELRHPVLFEDLIDQLYRHNWVVYAKEPFAGPEKVLQYLARYTHRVAISNDRLLTVDDDQVTFRYKDYAQGGVWRPMSLEPTDSFVDSSSTYCHAVSCGRYYGLLANRTRKANLERARELLQAQLPPELASVNRES